MYSAAKERLEKEKKIVAPLPISSEQVLTEISASLEKAVVLNEQNNNLVNATLVTALEKFTGYLSKLNENAELEHQVLIGVKAKLEQL